MAQPLAYLLTWTCYRTWLHGDDRGSVDSETNQYGESFLPPSVPRQTCEQKRLTYDPFTLGDGEHKIVSETIKAHCQHRGWELLAVNIRTTHVHVVVSYPEVLPKVAMNQLKSWSTRRLREAHVVDSQWRLWTNHCSTRYLWTPVSVEAAINYVKEYQ